MLIKGGPGGRPSASLMARNGQPKLITINAGHTDGTHIVSRKPWYRNLCDSMFNIRLSTAEVNGYVIHDYFVTDVDQKNKYGKWFQSAVTFLLIQRVDGDSIMSSLFPIAVMSESPLALMKRLLLFHTDSVFPNLNFTFLYSKYSLHSLIIFPRLYWKGFVWIPNTSPV